jgi:hypothetical protein
MFVIGSARSSPRLDIVVIGTGSTDTALDKPRRVVLRTCGDCPARQGWHGRDAPSNSNLEPDRLASPRAYARSVSAPRDVIDHRTAAQNVHDLEAMLACFHEDYRSE